MSVGISVPGAASQQNLAFPTYPGLPALISEDDEDDHECSGLGCDMDEATHGLYAVVKNMDSAGCTTGGFAADAHTQAWLMQAPHHAVASLAYDPLVHGASGYTGLAAGSAITIPFAGLAMYAGMKEWREAAKKAKDFAAYRKQLEAEAAYADMVMLQTRGNIGRLANSLSHASQSRIAHCNRAASASRYGGRIGKYSFLSGTAIMARVGDELGRNGVAAVAAKGGVAGTFLTGTGLISNALAPLAAAFALMLGLNFVRKARESRDAWRIDAKQLKQENGALKHGNAHYGRFVDKKLQHRADVCSTFTIKNRVFLFGAGLYTIGTALPVCIKILAALGVTSKTILSPKVLLALFATAIAGAIVMGVFSHQFFFGHPKQDRYDGYALRSTPDIERKFLSSLDIFPFLDNQTGKPDAALAHREGFAMREAVFGMVKAREQIRADLMHTIAGAQRRILPHVPHVGDAGFHAKGTSWKRIKFLINPTRLKTKDVQAWIEDSANHDTLNTHFAAILDTQIKLNDRKEKLQERMDALLDKNDNAQIKLAELLSGSRAKTTEHGEALRGLAADFRVAKGRKSNAELWRDMLALQGGEKIEETRKMPLEKHVAIHLAERMVKEHSHDRGTLLEIEREAGRMRRTFVWK